MSIGGGTSTTDSNSTTNTTTNPWGPTIQPLTRLVNQAAGLPTAVTPAQTAAFGQLESNVSKGDPNAGAYASTASGLLNSTDRTGVVDQGLTQLNNRMGGIADGNNLDVANNPQIQGLLKTVQDNVSNQVNGEFAAAGRDFSGYNQRALGTGIAAAEAPILLNQYNTERQAQANAAGGLYGAASNTATTDAGLDQSKGALAQLGAQFGDKALSAANYGPSNILNLEQQQTALPFQNLGMLAQLIAPVASLGGTSNANTQGSSTTTGVNARLNILSDEDSKTEKEPVGMLADGTPIHKFRYKHGGPIQIGVMAQEVEKKTPGAVDSSGPLKTVDYDKATERSAEIIKALRNKRAGAANYAYGGR